MLSYLTREMSGRKTRTVVRIRVHILDGIQECSFGLRLACCGLFSRHSDLIQQIGCAGMIDINFEDLPQECFRFRGAAQAAKRLCS